MKSQDKYQRFMRLNEIEYLELRESFFTKVAESGSPVTCREVSRFNINWKLVRKLGGTLETLKNSPVRLGLHWQPSQSDMVYFKDLERRMTELVDALRREPGYESLSQESLGQKFKNMYG